jgi:hypothetical protein
MGQAVQIPGALLILAAFGLSQFGFIPQQSLRYQLPNLIGSALLGVDAYLGEEWGFVLLEGAWAVISAWWTVKILRERRAVA